MCKLCRKSNRIDPKNALKIKRVIHRVIRQLRPSKIILFGSFARGDYHRGSDIDLIVTGNFKDNFFDRIGKVLDLNDTDLAVESIVYTDEEFERMVNENRSFIVNALEEGIIVYES